MNGIVMTTTMPCYHLRARSSAIVPVLDVVLRALGQVGVDFFGTQSRIGEHRRNTSTVTLLVSMLQIHVSEKEAEDIRGRGYISSLLFFHYSYSYYIALFC
jgi:hypothetical protein